MTEAPRVKISFKLNPGQMQMLKAYPGASPHAKAKALLLRVMEEDHSEHAKTEQTAKS